jgi:hypothetical protein
MDNKQAAAWFRNRLNAGILPGARVAFEAALAALEAADAVKIVRCQDCEWSNCYDAVLGRIECTRFLGSMQVREDDFCSYAVPKK